MDNITNTLDNTANKFIDCHCHLQYYSKEELQTLLKCCIQRGVIGLLTNSTNPNDFKNTLDIVNSNNPINNHDIKIIPGFGYHPWELTYASKHSYWSEEFISFLNSIPSSIKYFIGEIGIDGGKIKKTFPLDFQIEIFSKQLQYANEKNLLVQIHCVYEWDKLFKIMNELKLDNLIKNQKIILHSFQGKPKHIDKFITLNVWYSLSSGCYCEKNIEMIKKIPLDKLVYESDSPSMFNAMIFPDDYDYKEMGLKNCLENKTNTPISIIFLNEKIAEIKCMKPNELSLIVLNNSNSILDRIISN